MEQMEMREKLEAVQESKDPIAELEGMLTEIRINVTSIAAEFSRAYEADEFDRARESVRKLQFLYKARTEIDELVASIEDELM
jgi:DnaJ-domain-containing protein 1